MSLLAILLISVTLIGFLISVLILNLNKYKLLKKQFSLLQATLLKMMGNHQAIRTELDELKVKYNHNLLFDPLTALPARQVFEDRLNQTLNQSKRYKLSFAILFLDIDSFKVINDALSHEVGDLLLKEIAMRLQNTVRQVDTLSRFAGDEFVFILPQLSKPESAAYVAQRILNALALPFSIKGQELYITGSIGISTYPNDGEEFTSLLQNADNAMHQAKLKARNSYQFYRQEMHELSQRELILSSCLQNEIVYHNFNIYYQPQVNVETKKIFFMQALMNWQHPKFGEISLDEFLRLAENNGKIIEIGEWLLSKALQQFKQWKSVGFHTTGISVTVSTRQMENPHFIHKVAQLLQDNGVDPACLVLEISEGILVKKIELIEKVSHMLKHLGVQIAVADFGTGHLSLQDLKRFPIDYLKIDGALVRDITFNKESEAIVKMIIALAKSLQITVVAEGIDDVNQKNALLQLGCVIMQGRLFSLPRPAESYTNDTVAI